MSDPERLSRDPSDPLARAVLRSMRDDAPPPGLRRRTLALLGLAAGAAGVVAMASSAKSALVSAAKVTVVTTRLGVAAWVAAGAVGGGMLVGAATHVNFVENTKNASAARTTQPARPPAKAASAPPEGLGAPPGDVEPTAALEPPEAPPQTPPAAGPEAPKKAPASPPPRPVAAAKEPPLPGAPKANMPPQPPPEPPEKAPPPAPAPPARVLAAEVASIDAARRALVAGDAASALRALASYEASFPGGSLRAEAKALRVEALAASGDRAGAEAAGRSFLLSYPDSPLSERVRAAAGLRGPK